MFGRFIRLYEEQGEAGAGGGGGGTPPPFDFAAFEKRMGDMLNKGINALDKKIGAVKTDVDGFKTTLEQRFKATEGTGSGAGAGEGAGSGDGTGGTGAGAGAGGGDPNRNQGTDPRDRAVAVLEARLKKQEEDLKAEKEERTRIVKESQEKELDSLLRTEIAKHNLGTDETRELAQADLFTLLRGKIARTEDGKIVGPEEMPIDQFVKTEITARPNFLPAKAVNGTGAGNGGSANDRKKKEFDIQNIRPFMSKAEKDQAWAAIGEAEKNLQASRGGR